MRFGWRRRRRTRRPQSRRSRAHYLALKESARACVMSRIQPYCDYYGVSYQRITIRNQRTRWGSCSSLKNLNFNYRIVLLPPELQDYIIAHEVCHLIHFNHSADFWSLVGETIADYPARVKALRSHAPVLVSYDYPQLENTCILDVCTIQNNN